MGAVLGVRLHVRANLKDWEWANRTVRIFRKSDWEEIAEMAEIVEPLDGPTDTQDKDDDEQEKDNTTDYGEMRRLIKERERERGCLLSATLPHGC